MPLYKKKPFPLSQPPKDLKNDERVFQIRFTKEIFKNYDEYINRINLYRQRVWVCKSTGKTNLTYEEALVSERHATEKVQHFPKELIGPTLRIVQFSTLKLRDLVVKVSQSIKDIYLVGEEVSVRKEDSLKPCKILNVLQKGKGNLIYEVGYLDKNKKVSETSIEDAEALVRKKPIVTQDVIKAFIRESTRCAIPWVIHDSLAHKFEIKTDIPEELKDRVQNQERRNESVLNDEDNQNMAAENGNQDGKKVKKRKLKEGEGQEEKPKKKNKKEEDDGNSRGSKQNKNEQGEGKSKATKSTKKKEVEEKPKMEEKPKKEPIKYPIEDTLVKPGSDDPVFTKRPSPATDFLIPKDCVGDLLMVWDFCTSFSKALHLWPVSLEDFEKAIEYKEGDVALIAETHFALLNVVLMDTLTDEDLQRKKKPKISIQNWKDHLCDFIESEEMEQLKSHMAAIRSGGYRFLDPKAKLEILHELVDMALNSEAIRSQLDEYIEERQALAASKREVQHENAKRKKEEQVLKGNAEAKQTQNGDISNENGTNQDENGHMNSNNENEMHENSTRGEQSCAIVGNKAKMNGGLKSSKASRDNDEKDLSLVHNGENGTDADSMGLDRDKKLLVKNGLSDRTSKEPKIVNGYDKSGGNYENGNSKLAITTAARKAALKQKLETKEAEEKEKEKERELARAEELKKRKEKNEILKQEKLKQQRELEVQKKQEHLEREIEKRYIRTSSLGKDRDHNSYWFFRREGRLFVQDKDFRNWGYYSSKEELYALINSLNPKGIREIALQRQLQKHQITISNAMQRRAKDIAHKLATEEPSLRRSSRVQTQTKSILTGFLAYNNRYRG